MLSRQHVPSSSPRRGPASENPASAIAAGGWRAKLKAGAKLTVRRLSELRASPHEIALGCALGVFTSVTPLLGVQTLMAVALAGLLRASVPAAVIGTFFGNPLSWPFIWASTYAMGLEMVGGLKLVGLEAIMLDPSVMEQNMLLLWGALIERSPQILDATAALLWPLLLPMLAGSLPIGLLTAAIVYYISRNVVRAWRVRRMTGPSAAAD